MALMSRLLDEALDLDEAARHRWLETLPPEHQALAPILREALLPAKSQAARFSGLETLPKLAPVAEPGTRATSHLQPGVCVGPYELIRSLGTGGMAQVWLARRADGAFKREVALKLPMLNPQRADLAERFSRERDILAALEHPHIARLYDAGIDAAGLPYLAMEYVRGEALTDWCDARQLGVSARLDLFLQVLEAVQYAHEKQVIHRDLKPSNILVTQSGQVRLLDFGVAKLLEAEGSEQAQLTEVHGQALTPDYASPELLRGDPVDDRGDVYSLGVLLYELLTGTRPYQLSRAASIGLLQHAIATVQPKRPSLQLTEPAAHVRATILERLTRQLRGDLDAIVLKALEKEPAQRYPTVLALAQDLRRYLKGKPVQAQPARLGYRARKFVLRHGVAVGAVTTALAVVLLTIGYTILHESPAPIKIAPSVGGIASFMPAVAPASVERSVAVLPFVDLSEKRDQEYFSDGLAEELLDLLVKIPGLRVIARTSSFSFKGKTDDIPTIARQLNVDNILEGSVRKSGNRLRVTTRLIRAATGEELWSETYDRELQDVFQVQDEIAGSVIGALQLKLAPRLSVSNTHHTSNTEAYNQYLIGRQLHDRGTVNDRQRAIESYRKAIELDPGYAAAHAALAMSQSTLATYAGGMSQMREAVKEADTAVELGPDEADGYVSRGALRYLVNWDWSGAQADFEKALLLDPGDSNVQRRYGVLLVCLGRLPEAIALLKQATRSDPLSAQAWNYLGYASALDGQFGAARVALQRAIEIQPGSRYFRYSLGILNLRDGHASEALAAFRDVDSESLRLSGVAVAEHTLGHARESQQALDELIAKAADNASYQIAEVYAWRGQKDRAFEWLAQAYRQHDTGLCGIKTDPMLAALRGDPRFAAMLAKVHLS
ncbi:MAG: eukaryotic-like serine/threonine-protein kinase [Gammaproteobacteria bacterium]|nr:eukaryotic-like serine/threonine-protein kinase [Gammaproteobacteria bacterium]